MQLQPQEPSLLDPEGVIQPARSQINRKEHGGWGPYLRREPGLVLLAVDDGVPETSFLCAPHTLIRADGKPRLSSSQSQEPCSLYSGESSS